MSYLATASGGAIDDGGAAHVAHMVRRLKRRGAVRGAAVVPDHQVADLPPVTIDELRFHASDVCDEKRMNRCNGEFHAAAPGSGIAERTIEPALMVPQTEAAVLTEPCNLADKAGNFADIG